LEYLQDDQQCIQRLASLYAGNTGTEVMYEAMSMPDEFERHCRLNIQGIHPVAFGHQIK
jgi:hypothetical protein